MSTDHVRILLADDHAMFREGLRRLMESESDMRVVGEASNTTEAIRLSRQLQADVLLLDLSMPGGGGLDTLKALLTGPPTAMRSIVLTAGSSEAVMVEALQLGARGIVLKESATALLFRSIRCVMEGQFWVGHGAVADVIEAMRRLTKPNGHKNGNPFGLTPREMEIVPHVAGGATNRDIAQLFSVREDTVKHHMSSIFDKLGVYSRLELAIFAINHGLTEQRSGNGSS
jgi:two-component system nitrate/nitrite response regulator NarL